MNNGIGKILSIIAFAVFMGISCWATTESLHLLLPEWPIVIFWAISIGLFVLASIGTKLIVDGLNTNTVYVENPGMRIFGGIVMLLFFWVLFSIPTNTHTFFYKSSIKDVLIQDLANTKDRLQDLNDDQTAQSIINKDKEKFIAEVDSKLRNFKLEINNPGNPGWADRAEECMIELENTLGVKIQRINLKDNSHKSRQQVNEEISKTVEELKQIKIKEKYDSRLENIAKHKNKKQIQENIKALTAIENKLKKNPDSSDEPTVATNDVLTRSYALIGNYMDFLQKEFGSTHKEEMKTINENVKVYKSNITQTAKMRSVIDVWKGLLQGDPIYKGRGLWYWIIVALMVDIAGFIFFDIAFRKRQSF